MSDAKPVCRYPVPELEELPDDIRDRILAVQEQSGFVPNVFLALARRPREFRAFVEQHDAIVENPDSRLTMAEREMIVVAVSSENHCMYCVVAHGGILRVRAKSSTISDQITANYRKADITAKQRAMLDFALKVNARSHEIEESDFADLEAHGWDREDAWDIVSIAAFFALSNRLANTVSIRPNDEFYRLGRHY